MLEPIQKYLRENSLLTKVRVSSHFQEEVDEFSILISKILVPLQRYIGTVKNSSPDDPKYSAYGIMIRGTNSLMAGLELALNGYFWEPPMILRCALEQFSVGWDIIHNPKRFEKWVAKKKFSSTDSVTACKEINPIIGQLYGMLSNYYTHFGPENFSPAMIVNGEETKFQFFGQIRPGKESIREGEIYLSLLLAFVCLQMTELSFHAYSNDHETVERVPGVMAMKTKVTERHRKFADRAMDHFRKMAEDPMGNF